MFIFWERERQSASRGGAETEGDTESETGSRLWAVSTEPDMALELMNCEIMTWAEVGCLTNWATQEPLKYIFYSFTYLFLKDRETEHEWGMDRERGRHRIWSRPQAPSCQHRARHGARTHEPWDHDLSRSWTLNRLSHPGVPQLSFNHGPQWLKNISYSMTQYTILVYYKNIPEIKVLRENDRTIYRVCQYFLF